MGYAGGGAGGPTCPGSYGSATNGGGAGNGGAGAVNTGGGGAGSYNVNGGNGGSGVVIVSFPTGSLTASATGDYSITSANGNTIYIFKSGTGTFNVTSIP